MYSSHVTLANEKIIRGPWRQQQQDHPPWKMYQHFHISFFLNNLLQIFHARRDCERDANQLIFYPMPLSLFRDENKWGPIESKEKLIEVNVFIRISFGKIVFYFFLTLSNRVAIDRRIDTPIFFFLFPPPVTEVSHHLLFRTEHRASGISKGSHVNRRKEKTFDVCFLHYIRSIVYRTHPKQLGQNPACKWWIGQPSASTDQDELTNISLSSCVFLFFYFLSDDVCARWTCQHAIPRYIYT
jgi:hypothetical protein